MSNANEAGAARGTSRIKHRTLFFFFLNEKFQDYRPTPVLAYYNNYMFHLQLENRPLQNSTRQKSED